MTLTPEQFDKIALKSDFDRLEKRVDEIAEGNSKIIEAVEGLTTLVKAALEEQTANVAAHDRMQEQLDKHENILKQLAPGLAASI